MIIFIGFYTQPSISSVTQKYTQVFIETKRGSLSLKQGIHSTEPL